MEEKKMSSAPNSKVKKALVIAKSKSLKIALIVIGEILLIFLVFAIGVAIGLKKAKFSYSFGENYERNFVGPKMRNEKRDNRPGMLPTRPQQGFMNEIENRDFRNAHGLAGTVISISSDNTIVVKDRDDKENIVSVNEKTLIKSGRENLKITDLKAGDELVVMGTPNSDGVINATLIRVFNSAQTSTE